MIDLSKGQAPLPPRSPAEAVAQRCYSDPSDATRRLVQDVFAFKNLESDESGRHRQTTATGRTNDNQDWRLNVPNEMDHPYNSQSQSRLTSPPDFATMNSHHGGGGPVQMKIPQNVTGSHNTSLYPNRNTHNNNAPATSLLPKPCPNSNRIIHSQRSQQSDLSQRHLSFSTTRPPLRMASTTPSHNMSWQGERSFIDLTSADDGRNSQTGEPRLKPLASLHSIAPRSIAPSTTTNQGYTTSLPIQQPSSTEPRLLNIQPKLDPKVGSKPTNETTSMTMPSKKRKAADASEAVAPKKQKAKRASKPVKPKEKKNEPVCSLSSPIARVFLTLPKAKEDKAKYNLGHDIWMKILEFTPPLFLNKARLINRTFKGYVDEFESIYTNNRKENFGYDMPGPPAGMSERYYNHLLGGKGCMEKDCPDKNASRTHWPWLKRWCLDHWKGKIERQDRIIRNRQHQFDRQTLDKLLLCIPVGVYDSFIKPHDYVDNAAVRNSTAPRLYKYHVVTDVEEIIKKYEALTPKFVDDPSWTPEEKTTALAAHQALMDGLDEKRNDFLNAGKAKNDEHMAIVQKIEAGIKSRRETNRKPNDENRQKRKALFSRRAQEDLPHIPLEFVQSTKAFKAATRIFRDAGTERGWRELKPKIVKEFEIAEESKKAIEAAKAEGQIDGSDDNIIRERNSRESTQTDVSNEGLPSLPQQIPLGSQHHFRNASMQATMQAHQLNRARMLHPSQFNQLGSMRQSNYGSLDGGNTYGNVSTTSFSSPAGPYSGVVTYGPGTMQRASIGSHGFSYISGMNPSSHPHPNHSYNMSSYLPSTSSNVVPSSSDDGSRKQITISSLLGPTVSSQGGQGGFGRSA